MGPAEMFSTFKRHKKQAREGSSGGGTAMVDGARTKSAPRSGAGMRGSARPRPGGGYSNRPASATHEVDQARKNVVGQKGRKPNDVMLRGMHRAEELGADAERSYLDRAKDYSAQDALNTSARGAFDMVSEDLSEAIGDLRGSQVATGRLKTGFADIDEDRLSRSVYRDFSNNLAQKALQAEGLNVRNMEGMARFGNTVSERGASMASGQRDYEEYLNKKKGKKWGKILGGVGAVAGSFFGQPALGAKIGSSVGGMVGG